MSGSSLDVLRPAVLLYDVGQRPDHVPLPEGNPDTIRLAIQGSQRLGQTGTELNFGMSPLLGGCAVLQPDSVVLGNMCQPIHALSLAPTTRPDIGQ